MTVLILVAVLFACALVAGFMFRVLRNFLAVSLLAGIVAAGWVLSRSNDPVYVVQEWVNYPRFKRYDRLITDISHKHGVDPMLIKAVIWRESRCI